jgi:hypothetical protein
MPVMTTIHAVKGNFVAELFNSCFYFRIIILTISFSDRDPPIRVPPPLPPGRGAHRVQKVSLSRIRRRPQDLQHSLQQDHGRTQDGPGKKESTIFFAKSTFFTLKLLFSRWNYLFSRCSVRREKKQSSVKKSNSSVKKSSSKKS